MGSDDLLGVIAKNCNNLEVLNIKGSRGAVTDRGFGHYVSKASSEAKANLMQLDISRCMLTQVTLVHLQQLTGKTFFSSFTHKLLKTYITFSKLKLLSAEVKNSRVILHIVLPLLAKTLNEFGFFEGIL